MVTGAVVAVGAHIGLAVAAESSFLVRDPVYADREVRLSTVEQALPAGSPVVVLLGTSRTGNGFDAASVSERLAKHLGRPAAAFNFGIAASGPILHRVHLARLLAGGHRPALLLVEVLPASIAELTDGPLEAKFLEGGRFRRDELDVLANYGIPLATTVPQWGETLTAPWYALRCPLMGRLAPSALPFLRRYDESRTCDAYGWHRIWEEVLTPEGFEEARTRAHQNYETMLWNLKPGGPAVQALRDTLALAREYGIPTRVVLMPEADWFRAFYSPAAMVCFDHWVRDLAKESGCPLVDARRWIPDAGFMDGHHLLPGGAAAFSVRLTDDVIAPALVVGGME